MPADDEVLLKVRAVSVNAADWHNRTTSRPAPRTFRHSTRNVALAKELGADHVIDYTRDDYTRSGEQYDLIVDIAGNHSPLAEPSPPAERGPLAAGAIEVRLVKEDGTVEMLNERGRVAASSLGIAIGAPPR